jgi:hypothetical protein
LSNFVSDDASDENVEHSMISLRSLPIAFRALFSSFLILIGVGYLMALTYIPVCDRASTKDGRGIDCGYQ